MEYVREKIRIAAPVGRVWAITSAFGAMEPWCPAVKKMELEGYGVGSVRIAYLEGGFESREQLLEVDADNYKIVYSLVQPNPLPLQNIRSTMQLFAVEPDQTDVLWYSEADDAPDDILASVAPVISEFYRENLEQLKALTEQERVVRRML